MLKNIFNSLIFATLLFSVSAGISQTPTETPPPPSAPPTLTIPEVRETVLPNGLTVAIIEKRGLPLVTASLLIKSGANDEENRNAGLADMTANLLLKGTSFRTATQIAEQIEFLGASISSGAGWDSSSISINTMKSNLGRALAIMSDVTLRPSFPEKEIQLLKKQELDGFNVSLKQPGALLNYVSSIYSFGEHLSGGTPETVKSISRDGVVKFHREHYRPENSVLIFTGDISDEQAFRYAKLFFGGWEGTPDSKEKNEVRTPAVSQRKDVPLIRRILVIDLPDSGQAAVGYTKRIDEGRTICTSEFGNCATSDIYDAATVLNSVLGGGYSSRLNQEIRLKRGLSYGAGSGFSWRRSASNFRASAQTKNESAGEVAELLKIELEKLRKSGVSLTELVPRKAVVTGSFGRSLQTNDGLASQVSNLYLYNIKPDELNSYMNNINAISEDAVKEIAMNKITGGDIIIVGDSKLFMEDLQKRFSNQTIEVIRSSSLDLNSKTLRRESKILQ